MKHTIAFFILLVLIVSCSRKNAGFTNKSYHNVTAWNNTLFNGQQAFDAVLKDKLQEKDNFFEILPVEKINPYLLASEDSKISDVELNFKNGNNPNPTQVPVTGYERAVLKSVKAIQKHSINIKGKEHNKMMVRAYMLMGKSYLYQGKYLEAIESFSYIQKNMPKSKAAVESRMLLAEAQARQGNNFDASELFLGMENNKMKKKDKKAFYRKYAQFLLDSKKYTEAAEVLETAYNVNKNKKQRGRIAFIQAQLQELQNDSDKAYSYYQKVYKLKPDWEFEVKSQIGMAKNFNPKTQNFTEKQEEITSLLKEGQYQSRRNELYYALANLAAKSDSSQLAEQYYKNSLAEKESDPEVRASAYLELGEKYFKRSKYLQAGLYYDSAYIKTNRKLVKKQLELVNKNIKRLADRYYVIKKNDSIISLYNMSEAERNDFFTAHISKLKKIEAEKQKELEEQTTVFATESYAFTIGKSSNAGKFFMYNASQKIKDQQEFTRIWGNRPLTDNWRSSKKSGSIQNTEAQLLGQDNGNHPERFNLDFYTSKIPKTKSRIDSLKQERDTAQLALGISYFSDFKDKISATESLTSLVKSPPFHDEIRLQAMYNLYSINKEGQTNIADEYKSQILAQYPNSKYAEFILNPTQNYFTAKNPEAIKLYNETYALYEKEDYDGVRAKANEAIQLFPNDVILAKFSLLSVFCDAKKGNKEEFLNGLERVKILFDGTPEAERAAQILKDLKEKK